MELPTTCAASAWTSSRWSTCAACSPSRPGRRQADDARRIWPVACLQNHCNIAHRDDDALIDALAGQGIAQVPFFPLGGFTLLQSDALSAVAARLEATPMQVALTWLLQRSPNVLLIGVKRECSSSRKDIGCDRVGDKRGDHT